MNLNDRSLKILRENLGEHADKLFNDEQTYNVKKYLEEKINLLENNSDSKDASSKTISPSCDRQIEDTMISGIKQRSYLPVVHIQSRGTRRSFWNSFKVLVSRGNKMLYRDKTYIVNRIMLDCLILSVYITCFMYIGSD